MPLMYSWKIWRELNLADWSQPVLTQNLADSGSRQHCTQCYDFILTDFNLAVGLSIRQTAKLNSSPNFPAIWYDLTKHASHLARIISSLIRFGSSEFW